MSKLTEATCSGQVAGYNKNLDPAIKRDIPKEKGCPSCEALDKLGSRVI